MKIELDTINKTVKFEGRVKIKDALAMVKKLLPNDWADFYIEGNTVINHWDNPIIIEKYTRYPKYDWYCKSDSNKALCLNAGNYQIEANI